MEPPDVDRAIDAAISIAVALDLAADDATVLQNSNKLALRLLPSDVFARVAHRGREVAALEIEPCCRGPVEFDLAHVPESVIEHYRDVDHALLGDCRQLVLAMVATWRWELGDQLPNGMPFGRALLRVLRSGPPWPTIDEVFGRLPAHQP